MSEALARPLMGPGEATFVCTALCQLADMVCLSLASQLLNATIIKNKSIKIYN